MNIHIIEVKTGRVVGTVPVALQGLNYTPSEQEFIAEAWQSAVSDGLVNDSEADNYNFRMSH